MTTYRPSTRPFSRRGHPRPKHRFQHKDDEPSSPMRMLYNLLALLVASMLGASLLVMALVPLFPRLTEPLLRFACPNGYRFMPPPHGLIRDTFGMRDQIYCLLNDGTLQNHSFQTSIHAWIFTSFILFLTLAILGGTSSAFSHKKTT